MATTPARAKTAQQKVAPPTAQQKVAPSQQNGTVIQLAVVRLRGEVPANKKIRDTLRILGLRRVNSCVIMNNTPSVTGMLQKAYSFVTWGPVTAQTLELLKAKRGTRYRLSPATLKSKKSPFPKGDLGFRGDKINELIQEMA